MKNQLKRKLGLVIAILFCISCLTAFVSAESGSAAKNGISITVAATAWTNSAGSYAVCNSATTVFASISAYNSNGTRIGYDCSTGTTDAMAETAPTATGAVAKGASSATISGTATTGPSCTVNFD